MVGFAGNGWNSRKQIEYCSMEYWNGAGNSVPLTPPPSSSRSLRQSIATLFNSFSLFVFFHIFYFSFISFPSIRIFPFFFMNKVCVQSKISLFKPSFIASSLLPSPASTPYSFSLSYLSSFLFFFYLLFSQIPCLSLYSISHNANPYRIFLTWSHPN